MDFIGREKELAILEEEYSGEHSFIVTIGRRRVGKTRLLTEFSKNKNALYFLATQSDDNSNLEDFSIALSEYSGKTYGKFTRWQDAFKAFAEIDTDKKILIIDEFQYLCISNPAFPSILQSVWDQILSNGDVMLIICGSYISMMEKQLYRNRPLYGRATSVLRVHPLPFSVTVGKNFKNSVKEYAVHGGVPKYMQLLEGSRSLREGVQSRIFRSSSVLFDEPYFLLTDEVQDPYRYISVMKAVAAGNRRLSSISSAMEAKGSEITPYISRLIEIKMLKRDVPVTEYSPETSKMGRYSLGDNFLAFWFRFVFPHLSGLSSEDTESTLKDFDEHFVEDRVSFVFEDICREQTWKLKNELGFSPDRVGSFWNKNIEIDVVAVNDKEKKIFVAECKFKERSKVDMHILNELKKKCSRVREFEGYEIIYGLFSVSGFDDKIVECAKHNEVILINEGKVLTSGSVLTVDQGD